VGVFGSLDYYDQEEIDCNVSVFTVYQGGVLLLCKSREWEVQGSPSDKKMIDLTGQKTSRI
jgi:hypothetical protein